MNPCLANYVRQEFDKLDIMKKSFIILLIFLVHISSYGQEIASIGLTPDSKISLQLNSLKYSKEGDSLKIDLISTPLVDVIYGDAIRNSNNQEKTIPLKEEPSTTKNFKCFQYGGAGDLFYNNIKKHNQSLDIDYIKRIIYRGEKDNADIKINCSWDDLTTDTLILKFSKAYYADFYTIKENNKAVWGGWYPSDTSFYIVKLYQYRTESTASHTLVYTQSTTSNKISESDSAEGITIDDIAGQNNPEFTLSYSETILGSLTLICIVLIILLFIRINRLNRKINRLNRKINKANTYQTQTSSRTKEINIDEIILSVISKIQSKDLAQRISNEDIYNVISRSDIQLYIQTVIAGKVDEYLRNNKIANPVPADINSGYNQQSPVVQPELRTTNVEYRADNNCFMVSENPEYRIFEVYSANGKYYYTIINDSAIRRNLLSIIAAFSKCIDHRLDSPIPTTVEVIKDGQLIKNGDVYIVDTNCILQVSLM